MRGSAPAQWTVQKRLPQNGAGWAWASAAVVALVYLRADETEVILA